MSSDSRIVLQDVVKIFGPDPTGSALELLNQGASNDEIREQTGHVVGVGGVSAAIGEGEVFVVMGLSGSGKSTLIRCCNRIHEPTAGSVIIDGQDITELDIAGVRDIRRQKMAMVFQHFALFPHKTVLENAAYGLKVQGVVGTEQQTRARDALELVGLAEWAELYPHNLSGGMQQRVGLARALATDPDVLLMDEAFSALDPLIRRQMQNELLALQDKMQKTIVFITHDLNEALRIGSRVMIMKAGKVVQVGTPTEIVTDPENDYVAAFMADVDHAKVLPARHIAREARVIDAGTSVAQARSLIQDAESAIVVDAIGSPLGRVRSEQLDGDGATVGDLPLTPVEALSASTPLALLFGKLSEGSDIVVTDRGRVVGDLVTHDLLAALGAVEVVDGPTQEESR